MHIIRTACEFEFVNISPIRTANRFASCSFWWVHFVVNSEHGAGGRWVCMCIAMRTPVLHSQGGHPGPPITATASKKFWLAAFFAVN